MECEHLQSLKSEPADVQQAVEYMELLTKVQDLKYVPHIVKLLMLMIQLRMESDHAKVAFQSLDFDIVNNDYKQKEIAGVRTCYQTTFTCWQVKEEELTRYEEEHSIDECWLPGSDIYKEIQKLLAEWSYQQAVDNLERLVMQQLFELTKLGMNGIGNQFIVYSFEAVLIRL